MYNSFCINLEKRYDRKENMQKMFDKFNITDVNFVKAVDGKQLEPSIDIYKLFYNNNFSYRKGVIGCALSHYELWKQLLNDTDADFYIIYEDDIVEFAENTNQKIQEIISDLKNVDWDLMFLGFHKAYNENHFPSVNSLVSLTCQYNVAPFNIKSNEYAGGLFSYMIHKNGAEKIINYIKKNSIFEAIDYIFYYIDDLKILTTIPHLTHSNVHNHKYPNTDTNIQNDYSFFEFDYYLISGFKSKDTYDVYVGNNWNEYKLMKICNRDNNIVGFDSYGFLKYNISTLEKDPNSSIYVKTSKFLKIIHEHQLKHYFFYPNKDSYGNDIGFIRNNYGMFQILWNECIAYNTHGYVKNDYTSTNNFIHLSDRHGLFIKKIIQKTCWITKKCTINLNEHFVDAELILTNNNFDLLQIEKYVEQQNDSDYCLIFNHFEGFDFDFKKKLLKFVSQIKNNKIAYNIHDELFIVPNKQKFKNSQFVFLNKNFEFEENKATLTLTSTKKQTLCFYIGYSIIIDPNTHQFHDSVYGSEIALYKLAIELSKIYNIYIITLNYIKSFKIDNIVFINADEFVNINVNTDILIISRYINYFIEYNFYASKIYLWMHDHFVHPYYKNFPIKYDAKNLLINVGEKIDKIITLTNTHKSVFYKHYFDNELSIDSKRIYEKLDIIGNGIDILLFKKYEHLQKEKKKYRFIWTSNFNRGIERAIEYFLEIKQKLSQDAQLHIIRDIPKNYIELVNKYSSNESIFFYGKKSYDEIVQEFQISDIWFYPTDFVETYCISALEAQCSRCLCICTDIGALKDTISDRGLLLPKHIVDSKEKCVQAVCDYLNISEQNKNNILDKAYEWATQQSWQKISNKWIALFNS